MTTVALCPESLHCALRLLHHVWDPTDPEVSAWRPYELPQTLRCYSHDLANYVRPLAEARMDDVPFRVAAPLAPGRRAA